MKRAGKLSPTSKKRLLELKGRPEIRAKVFERDGGCRFAAPFAGTRWARCYGVLTAHHVLKASQGGKYREDNLVAACAHHNNLMESDAEAARLAEGVGLVRRRYPA